VAVDSDFEDAVGQMPVERSHIELLRKSIKNLDSLTIKEIKELYAAANAAIADLRTMGAFNSDFDVRVRDFASVRASLLPQFERVALRGVTTEGAVGPQLNDINISVREGELCALIGPGDSGASTILRVIAGLTPVTQGSVLIDGVDVTGARPSERAVAAVFQTYALYPHMSVRNNIVLPMFRPVARSEADARVETIASSLQLSEVLDRRPRQLSGGQQQRVALARALFHKPKVLVLDNIPAFAKHTEVDYVIRSELSLIREKLRTAMLYATRDQVVAMSTSDRIIVVNNGRVEQVGTPSELYGHPQNKFIAAFFGVSSGLSPMNFLGVSDRRTVGGDLLLVVSGGNHEVPVFIQRKDQLPKAEPTEIGIRAEDVMLVGSDDERVDLRGTISSVQHQGNRLLASVDTAAGKLLVEGFGERALTPNDNVGLVLNRERLHVFSFDGVAL
jgi:multiple sugar transport system ATP-binding protein